MSNSSQKYAPGFAVLFLLFFIIGISFAIPNTANTEEEVSEPKITLVNPYEANKIFGKAAVAYDVRANKILFAKNAETQLPLASVTKLMTAYVALTKIPNDTITIQLEDLSPEGDSGLLVQERWTVPTLAAYTLMTSSNDGAYALARASAEKNNLAASVLLSQEAQKLSLTQSYFLNSSGLDVSPKVSGGYGSALDVAKLLAQLQQLAPEVLQLASAESKTFYSLNGIPHTGINTNKIIEKLPPLLAGKTGFTDLAGGNLAVLIEIAPERPIALVVLDSGVDERFSDIEQLTAMTLRYFAQKEEVL